MPKFPTSAEILSATVESLVNAGTGRNPVALDRIRVLAAAIGPHAIEPYSEHGESFLAFRFADNSRVDYSPDDPEPEGLDSPPPGAPRTLSALLDRAAADISRLPADYRDSDHGALVAELRALADALRQEGEEWTPPAPTTTQRALDADMVNAARGERFAGRVFAALKRERRERAADPARFAVDGTTESGEYDGGTDRPPYAVHDAARQTWIAGNLPERWQAEAIATAARDRAQQEQRAAILTEAAEKLANTARTEADSALAVQVLALAQRAR